MFCNFDCASLLKLLCGFSASADAYTHIKTSPDSLSGDVLL